MSVTSPYGTLIFDLDGTLVDSARDLNRATNHVLSLVNRDPVPLEAMRSLVGAGARKLIERGLAETGGIQDSDIDHLHQEFLTYYGENLIVETDVFRGVKELLNEIRSAEITCTVCSNKPETLVLSVLESLGLIDYFGAVSGGDTYAYRKPDPRHLSENAKAANGTAPYLMIGDSEPDIAGAKALGVESVVVSYGYSPVPVESLGATHQIDHFSELRSIVWP